MLKVKCFLLLATLMLSSIPVKEVTAPPVFDTCYPGILASESGIRISNADVNMTILSEENDTSSLTFTILIEGELELTNSEDSPQNILLLYSPRWEWHYTSTLSNFTSSIAGNVIYFEQIVLNNLTQPIHLPPNFPSYEINNTDCFDVLANLTLDQQESIQFFFSDTIQIAPFYYLSQLQVGFCFNSAKIVNDSTELGCQIQVPRATNIEYIRVWCDPDEGLTLLADAFGDIAIWSVAPPYSSSFLNNIFPDSVSAGFLLTMVIGEYFPPSHTTSQPTSTTTDATSTTEITSTTRTTSTTTNDGLSFTGPLESILFGLLGSLFGVSFSIIILVMYAQKTEAK